MTALTEKQQALVDEMARYGVAEARAGHNWREKLRQKYPGVSVGLHGHADALADAVLRGELAESSLAGRP